MATASNLAFVSGFNSGFNIAQIEAVLPSFSPPGFTNAARRIHYPTYDEWNLEFQQALGSKMSFSVNYVGNHGSYLAAENPGLNAYCNGPTTAVPFQPGLPDCQSTLGVGAFVGLPLTPLDPRFTTITEVSNPGVSNYHGLTASFARQVNTAFHVRASFTWSHAMDDISNGGFLPFNFDTNTSILAPQDPSNFRRYNYGNADYDVRRHSISATSTTRRNFTAYGTLSSTGQFPARFSRVRACRLRWLMEPPPELSGPTTTVLSLASTCSRIPPLDRCLAPLQPYSRHRAQRNRV